MSEEEKKIIIDEDWKSQVEAEKEQAAAQQATDQPPASAEESDGSQESPETPATEVADAQPAEDQGQMDDDPAMPPASIGMLMSSLATEALISMGQFPHPVTGEAVKKLNQAQYLIDTLDLIKTKTKGNLTKEEETALDDVLHQLRMAFIASK